MYSSIAITEKKEQIMTSHTDSSSPERDTMLAKSVDGQQPLYDLYDQFNIGNKNSEWKDQLLCNSLGHTTSDTSIQVVKSQLPARRNFSLEINQAFKQVKLDQLKIQLHQNEHTSEPEANSESDIQNSQQSFDLYKHSWLTNKKAISAESINFEDKQAIEGPDTWQNCTVQLSNPEKTKTYTLECSKDHNLSSIIKLLARLEKRNEKVLSVVFLDEGSQKMAEQSSTLLQIAKNNQTKIIHVSFE